MVIVRKALLVAFIACVTFHHSFRPAIYKVVSDRHLSDVPQTPPSGGVKLDATLPDNTKKKGCC